MTTAPEQDKALEQDKVLEQDNTPRRRTRGHLALMEWETAPMEQTPQPKLADPVRRTRTDRLFERGIVLLLVTTVAAVLASLAHL